MARKLDRLPQLLVADAAGNIMAHPTLKMAGRSGSEIIPLKPQDLIPLPEGSDLYALPGRTAFGYDEENGAFVPLTEGPDGQEVRPMAAHMAPAYTAYALSAYEARPDAPRLPLFAYAAIGELDGRYYAAGIRVDPDQRQDHALFDHALVDHQVKKLLKERPGNRLVTHLADCATVKQCFAAKNFFLERFEAPLPTAPVCNAACVGCISAQEPDTGFPASHKRIDFTPTVEEITGCVLPHFAKAENPVASFGQGCEGEPLSQAPLLEASIKAIRASTKRGTININTNGSRPAEVAKLMDAGLDAIRVSMNSAQKAWYEAYYRPRGYSFEDAKESVRIVASRGGHASINYFTFPGVSDREAEVEALLGLIRETGLHLIQWRNLNLDPDLYLSTIPGLEKAGKAIGIQAMLERVRKEFPGLRYGYFNPAWREEALKAGKPQGGKKA
jgi:pyruvate-formate lyase-activating enzyme